MITDDTLPWLLSEAARIDRVEVREWLDNTLDLSGWSTKDFVACFVMVFGSGTEDDPHFLMELAAQPLAELLPLGTIFERLESEINAAPTTVPHHDVDVSLPNRSRHALASLRALRDTRYEQAPAIDPATTQRLHPARYASWPGSDQNTLVRAAVLADRPTKPASSPPSTSSAVNAEQLLQQVLTPGDPTDPAMAALSATASPGRQWNVLGTADDMTAEAVSAPDPSTPDRAAHIAIAAGPIDGERLLDAVFDIAVAANGGGTLLQVNEFVEIVATAVHAADQVARRAVQLALGAPDVHGVLAVFINLKSTTLDHLIDLDGIEQLPASPTGNDWTLAAKWPLTSPWEDPVRAIAAQAVGRALQRSGYRRFNAALEPRAL